MFIFMIVKMAEGSLQTRFGDYQEILFHNGQKESIALVMGDIKDAEGVLCRVHSSCLYGHVFNSIQCDCRQQMEISQQLIQKEGKGIIIWLDQEGKGNGHYALMKSAEHKERGLPQAQAYEAVGFKKDARDFTQAAEILHYIGIKSIRMLTDNSKKVETLTSHGVIVVGTQPVTL
jgi:GTP cyclohydrolase II